MHPEQMVTTPILLLLLLALLPVVLADHYKTLGLDRTATPAQIKRSYRKLALKHHPDKADPNRKSSAEKRFAEIGAAYEVLKDPQSKTEYDESLNRPKPHPGHFFRSGSSSSGGGDFQFRGAGGPDLSRFAQQNLSLIHISEPTRLLSISYAVFCLKKKKNKTHK
eukprot:TRINITY_DN56518_c0_g1_i1.p2 TRINITY_DN56518_c0_g1~~TRINITY_DN56518_c0_g1_i1.p2  ORF type:complete len:165 (+),score=46.17 TRINITY_DN56518_c0_g1_i1:96-590(+)